MAERYVVPDTCAIAAAFFNEPLSKNTVPMVEAIRLRSVSAIAPALGIAEFLNVSRKKVVGYQCPATPIGDVDAIVGDFFTLPILWDTIDGLAGDAWNWYKRGVPTGDAFFLQLALEWDAEIWTIDEPFFAAVAPHYPKIYNLRVTPFA